MVGVTKDKPPKGIVGQSGAPVLLNPFKELPLVINTDESAVTDGVVKILDDTTSGKIEFPTRFTKLTEAPFIGSKFESAAYIILEFNAVMPPKNAPLKVFVKETKEIYAIVESIPPSLSVILNFNLLEPCL